MRYLCVVADNKFKCVLQTSQPIVEVENMSEAQETPERCTQSGSRVEMEGDTTESTENRDQNEGLYSFPC